MGEFNKIKFADLKTGDALVFAKNEAISKAIQIFTRSKYNHVGLLEKRMYEKEDYSVVWEAVPPVFTHNIMTVAIDKHVVDQVIIKRPNFKFDEEKFIMLCRSLKGKPYDYRGIWSQIKRQLFGGWKGPKNIKKVYCSEAGYWVYNQLAGICPKWYSKSPGDMFEDLKNFDTFELDLKDFYKTYKQL